MAQWLEQSELELGGPWVRFSPGAFLSFLLSGLSCGLFELCSIVSRKGKRKRFNSHRTGSEHQHGRRFQYCFGTPIWRMWLHLKTVYLHQPFKPQYPNTNSPDWSPCISVKNWLREFVCWSKLFLSVLISLIFTTFSLDDVLIMLRESWLWSLLGRKGLRAETDLFNFQCGYTCRTCWHSYFAFCHWLGSPIRFQFYWGNSHRAWIF